MIEYQATIDKCEGCRSEAVAADKKVRVRFCIAYLFPAAKWERGRCNHTSIPSPEQVKQEAIKMHKPHKASKRKAKEEKKQ